MKAFQPLATCTASNDIIEQGTGLALQRQQFFSTGTTKTALLPWTLPRKNSPYASNFHLKVPGHGTPEIHRNCSAGTPQISLSTFGLRGNLFGTFCYGELGGSLSHEAYSLIVELRGRGNPYRGSNGVLRRVLACD